jgi:hypothetical protein
LGAWGDIGAHWISGCAKVVSMMSEASTLNVPVVKVIWIQRPSANAYVAISRGSAFQVLGPMSRDEATQLSLELGDFLLNSQDS